MQDFDAVSLYPSAMVWLVDDYGLPTGEPKLLTNDMIDMLNKSLTNRKILNISAFYVKITVKSLTINRQFPLQSIIDNNKRVFTNDLVNKCLYVDYIALEDLVNFQGVTYEIIEGYYFDGEVNNNIEKAVTHLFNQRLMFKSEKNEPAQQLMKLVLNSSYGKTCLKSADNTIKMVNNDKLDNYIINHSTNVIKSIPFNKQSIVYKINNKLTHFNRVHIGSLILSMSKWIMNEVMTLAEDIGIKIYYQDTDSMHLKQGDIDWLSIAFTNKYNW